jgi:hypothetical protein
MDGQAKDVRLLRSSTATSTIYGSGTIATAIALATSSVALRRAVARHFG